MKPETHSGGNTVEHEETAKPDLLFTGLELDLRDGEWPFTYVDHDREIVRAVVFDDAGWLYFTRLIRNAPDDEFGPATLIETSGGGVEPGEAPIPALRRELREELGAKVEVLCKLAVVHDFYNAIHRRNINHYYLCRALSFGDRHLTEGEQTRFHLSTLKLRFEEAKAEYARCAGTRLGRLIANREVPVLHRAGEILADRGRN